jgi:predicted nucleic acid-binding protein
MSVIAGRTRDWTTAQHRAGTLTSADAATAASVAGDRAVRGNLVPDAYATALAVSQGCRLATADRGFARFPGLDHLDPAA